MIRLPLLAAALLAGGAEAAAASQTADEQPASPQSSIADPPAADPAADGPAGQEADALPEDVQEFAEATLDATRLRFALNAFGDVSAFSRLAEDDDESATFSLGTFALLINGELSDSLLGTAEVTFETDSDNEQEVSLERLHLAWQTPRFFLVAGRTHSDLGYWNTAFHHGAWLHLPIGRPRALRGEDAGGILPIHWIGVEGGIRAGGFTLAGGVGNGRGDDEESIALETDTNDFKALKIKIEYVGLGWPDLRVGVGGLYDRIAPASLEIRPALPDEEIDEYIANAYVAYRGPALTLIAEAYSIWHRADDIADEDETETFLTADAFAVIGYRIGRLTPYTQIERTEARGDGIDPFYTPVPDMPTPSTPIDRTEWIVGARLDPSIWSAIKVEYRLARADASDSSDHTFAINWSFGI